MKLGKSGLSCFVDDADYAIVSEFAWSFDGRYACRNIKTRKPDGRRSSKKVYMHRFILGAKTGEYVDHRNGDGLDNRRQNIRICNQSQNNANRLKTKGSSRFKGVSFSKKENKWIAYSKDNGRSIRILATEREADAAKAYDQWVESKFGPFALSNRRMGLV